MQYQRINREGVFLARLIDQAVKQAPSGAVMFNMVFAAVAQYDQSQEAYVNLAQPEEVFGTLCLVRKSGEVSQASVERLTAALQTPIVDFDILQQRDWSQQEVQITVKSEEYNGRVRFRADWIAPADAPVGPGTLAKASTDALDALNASYGSQLRALAPPAPTAKPVVAARPAPAVSRSAPPRVDDDIPY